MLPTLPGAMARLWLLLLLLLVTSAVAAERPHDPAGGFGGGVRAPGSGGHMLRAEVEHRPRGRGTRCVPREELKPPPQHQYNSTQAGGILQHIKQRLEHLRVPDVDKIRKSKERSRSALQRRPSKQPKSKNSKNSGD